MAAPANPSDAIFERILREIPRKSSGPDREGNCARTAKAAGVTAPVREEAESSDSIDWAAFVMVVAVIVAVLASLGTLSLLIHFGHLSGLAGLKGIIDGVAGFTLLVGGLFVAIVAAGNS